jgi:hypothetical protein
MLVQLGRRLGLAPEALHRLGGQTESAGEHLQSHAALER